MGNEELSCPNTPMYDNVEQLEIRPGPKITFEQDENPQDGNTCDTGRIENTEKVKSSYPDTSVNLDLKSSMDAEESTAGYMEDDPKNIHTNSTASKEKNSSNLIVKESISKDKNSTEDIEEGSADITEKDYTYNIRKPDNTEKNCMDKMDNISADMENNCTNKRNERVIDNWQNDSMKNIEIHKVDKSSSDNIEKNSLDKKNLDPSCNKQQDYSNNTEKESTNNTERESTNNTEKESTDNTEKESTNNTEKESTNNTEKISTDKMDLDFSDNINQRLTSTENNSTNKSEEMSVFSEKVFENSTCDPKNRDEREKQKTEAIENLRECIQKTVDNCRALTQV